MPGIMASNTSTLESERDPVTIFQLIQTTTCREACRTFETGPQANEEYYTAIFVLSSPQTVNQQDQGLSEVSVTPHTRPAESGT